MNNALTILTTPNAHPITRRAGLLTLLGSALALAGCGGGGSDVAGLSSGGTGSFSVGPITGFGSVIVNGVRFDDSSASVSDDDGGTRDRSELKLGMMVVVTGSTVTRSSVAGDSATATAIVFGSELQGPISAIDTTLQTLTVLGQTVSITGSTIFDVSTINGGFAALAVNDIVEVHGVVNPGSNTIQATLIEKESSPDVFKIQGLISNLDAGAKQFDIGAIRISYLSTPVDEVRVTPANGVLVRVRLTAVLPPAAAPAVWNATRIRPPENHADENRDEAEVEGSITAFTSTAQFSVNGLAVDASSATFPDGTALAVGVRVDVSGRLSAGVLIADVVEIEDENEVDEREFQLTGVVSGLNTTAQTFVLRGVTVDYSGNPEFREGTVASLADGATVEVRGAASSDGTRIVATRIEFE